jgi:hypothetical protein
MVPLAAPVLLHGCLDIGHGVGGVVDAQLKGEGPLINLMIHTQPEGCRVRQRLLATAVDGLHLRLELL